MVPHGNRLTFPAPTRHPASRSARRASTRFGVTFGSLPQKITRRTSIHPCAFKVSLSRQSHLTRRNGEHPPPTSRPALGCRKLPFSAVRDLPVNRLLPSRVKPDTPLSSCKNGQESRHPQHKMTARETTLAAPHAPLMALVDVVSGAILKPGIFAATGRAAASADGRVRR